MSNSYLDFDLEIGKGKNGTYSVSARWQGNEAWHDAHLPPNLDPSELRQQIESAVLESPLRRRRPSADNEAFVQNFGQKLFDFALDGEVLAQWRACQRIAKSQKLEGVRLRLRILDPELACLPWEYLYDNSLRDFIALDPTLPLVRYLQHLHAAAPLKVNTPLRILGMVASPINLQSLNVDEEKQRVEQAVASLQAAGKLELVWLPGDGALDLQSALRKGPWHIFHFIGHGDFDPRRNEGYLALCNPISKQAEPLYTTHLVRLLAAQSNHLRFVLLNACESARGNSTDIFSSTAEMLINRDIPAVLAMQYAITDRAGTLFAQQLYQSLADGLPIDRGVAEARNALALADSQNLEWGVPVLHMRSPDGILFEVEKSGKVEDGQSGERAANLPTERSVQTVELENRSKETVGATYPKQIAFTPQTLIAYALAVAMLLVAGWLGWPYWHGEGSQIQPLTTATETASIASAPAQEVTSAEKPPQNAMIGTIWTEPTTGIAFVYVPAGEFLMGSTAQQIKDAGELCKKYDKNCDVAGYNNESPQSLITTSAFWIGVTEISNSQFRQFTDDAGYSTQSYWTESGWKWRNDNDIHQPACLSDSNLNLDNHPVVCITWYEAMAYVAWLKAKTGLEVRLPSEAEWEKAARGKDGLIYPWGDTFDGSRMNYCDSNCLNVWKEMSTNDGYAKTAPVGSFLADVSPYGALDMAGNVWEWNSTAWGGCNSNPGYSYPYLAGDGREDPNVEGCHLLRGGSWGDSPNYVRSAARNWGPPTDQFDSTGFRVVIASSPER